MVLVEVEGGDNFVVPHILKMDQVAGEDERAGLWQFDKQRLVPGRVARRRDDRNAAVTKHVAAKLNVRFISPHWIELFRPRCC